MAIWCSVRRSTAPSAISPGSAGRNGAGTAARQVADHQASERHLCGWAIPDLRRAHGAAAGPVGPPHRTLVWRRAQADSVSRHAGGRDVREVITGWRVDRLRSDESGRHEVSVQGFVADRVPPRPLANGRFRPPVATSRVEPERERAVLHRAGSQDDGRARQNRTPVRARRRHSAFRDEQTGSSPTMWSPDGRFLLNDGGRERGERCSPMTIVLNWQAGLKR